MLSNTDSRLDGVQWLRAAAATMIVFLHAEAAVEMQAAAQGLHFRPITGVPFGSGVDLFFVISGFIIVFASERFFAARGGAREFLKRRICRIVPLYWFALSLKLALLAAGAAVGAATFPDLTAIITSFAFVPYDAMKFGPRYPFPFLDLGWTLNYEMLFYALFASVIWLPRLAASLTAVAVLLTGVLIVWVWQPENVPLWFWFQPIVLEFALGIGVALLHRRGVRLSRLSRAGLIGLGLAFWLCVDVTWFDTAAGPGWYGWTRLFVYGGGAALILAGVVLGATKARNPVLQSLSALGDSSYALYLLHPFILMVCRLVLKKLPLSEPMLWPAVVAIVLIAMLVAHRFHRSVEQRVVRALTHYRYHPGLPSEALGHQRS